MTAWCLKPEQVVALQEVSFVGFAIVLFLLVAVLVRRLFASPRRPLPPWVAVGTLFCLLLGAGYYFPFTNDDAYIVTRYAANAIAGHGFVYNIGERVEGFTCPAWVLLTSLAGWTTGANVVVLAKVLGIVLAVVTAVILRSALKLLTGDAEVASICCLLFCANQLLLSWIGSGMDVAAFLLFEVALLQQFLRPAAGGAAYALSAFGFFVRPEAYLFLGVYWAKRWACDLRARRLRRLGLSVGAVALLALLPFVLRYLYYGDLLPNTYYAKSARPAWWGVLYLMSAGRYFGFAFLALVVVGLLSRQAFPWITTCVILYVAYLIYVGGDVLSHRFTLFLLPWFMVGLAIVLHDWIAGGGKAKAVAAALLVALAVESLGLMDSVQRDYRSQDGHLYVPNNARGTAETDYRAGEYLARVAKPSDVLVTNNIGAVGYLSRLKIVDTYGLTSREVARLIRGADMERIRRLIVAARAEWVLCNDDWTMGGVGDLSELARDYEVVKRWTSRTGYSRVLLRRRVTQPDAN